MKTNKQILTEAYNAMPDTFSSNQFCNLFLHLGGAKQYINNGYCLEFFKKTCDPLGISEKRCRSWKKRTTDSPVQISLKYELTDKICIDFLKKRDYKIYKIQTVEI